MKTAIIGQVADLIKISESFKDVVTVPNPPGPGLSCLRGFFFFEQKDPVLYTTHGRTWWMTGLRELRCGMDKKYSRAASMLAISRLTNEINILRDPQQAEERFRLMSLGLTGLSGTPMEKVEEDNKESSA